MGSEGRRGGGREKEGLVGEVKVGEEKKKGRKAGLEYKEGEEEREEGRWLVSHEWTLVD